MTNTISTDPKPTIESKDHSRASLWTGIILTVLGIAGITLPTISSFVVETWIALILVSAGTTKLIYAIQTRRQDEGFIWKILISVLYIATGVMLFFAPLTGVLTLTLLLGSFLLTEGTFNIVLAFRLRSQPNWYLVLIDGVITLALGAMIWFQFPFDAPWVIGTIVGASVLLSGISRISLAFNHPVATATSPTDSTPSA